MLPSEIEELARKVLPDAGAVRVERVRQGLVNETFRVSRGGSVYAFRMAADRAVGLGVDREWELQVVHAAASAQLAPELVYADTAQGTLVSRWADGHGWGEHEVRSPAGMRRMTDVLRQIHALNPDGPRRSMQPAAWIEFYAERQAPTSRLRVEFARRANVCLVFLVEHDLAPVLCHSDLHAQNIVDDGASLRLLDWEYAHFSDPFWDIAAWCANNDFDEPARRCFLDAYLGRTAVTLEWSRLRNVLWLFDYVCLLWSELYLRTPMSSGLPAVAARAAQIEARLDSEVPAH